VSARVLDWGCAARPRPGEDACGDRALVVTLPDAGVLAAAIDGVGHGREAARAAARATATLEAVAAHEPDPEALLRRCHAELRGTRGVAMSLALVDGPEAALAWLAVGNVEGRVVRPGRRAPVASLLLPGGAAGLELPPLRPARVELRRGDLLLLATDGIDARFADEPLPEGRCDRIAERLLARHARSHDDALVLVARFLGRAPGGSA
jgi:hypothetical protein